MKKRILALILALALILSAMPFSALADFESDYSEPEYMAEFSGRFNYNSFLNEGASASWDYSYNDSWFLNTGYQHDLAKMSLRMAIAGASGKADNIKALFDSLGFKYTDESVSYVTPTADSIGYAIASREFKDSKGEVNTVIAVVIRGHNYGSEWASNFTVGSGNEHKGFGDSADIVAAAVKNYIKSIGVTKNIKLWTTGYSRAAAVANILGQRFNNWYQKNSVSGVSKNGIYAYTFETPRTVKIAKEGNYDNIFNITNHNDLVTKITPALWGFGRYGVTYFLPSPELSADYAKENAKASAILKNIAVSAGFTAPVLPVTDDVGSFTDNAIDRLAAYFISQNNYSARYEQSFRSEILKLGTNLNGANITSVISSLNSTELSAFAMQNISIASRLLTGFEDIALYHYLEICLALLDSIDSAYDYCNPVTRHVKIGGSVEITVYDSQNNIIAKTKNGKFTTVPGSSTVGFIDDSFQKVIVLPSDGEYRVQVKALKNTTINFYAEDYNAYNENINRSISYKGVTAASGDSFSLTLENLNSTSHPAYALRNGKNEILAASSSQGFTSVSLPFTDVKKGDKFYDDIVYAYENGLMSGTSDTEFAPGMSITRSMIVTILYRLEGKPAVGKGGAFSDVKADKYYANPVAWASKNKIVEGMGDGTFAPESNINREQLASILYRYAVYKNSDISSASVDALSFSDSAGVHSWAERAVRWCAQNGVMTARNGSAFAPTDAATRGESAAAMHGLCRVLGK